MTTLKPGLKGHSHMQVGRDDLASVMGNIGAEVLSTHRVVLLMELAARDAIAGCLPEGMMTVGTGIRIRHLAATPLGVKVWAEACLRDIMRHRLVFDVVAHDEFEKISEGQNEQLIISSDTFFRKMRRKISDRAHR
jgi:fluoroacetyl-CoA thioesterase